MTEQTRRKPPKRRSSTYPPQFPRLLLHVANTQEPLIVKNLGNERKYYTSFRARVNEFRRAFYDEAMSEGNQNKLDQADMMYSVTLEDPKKDEHGQWFMRVKPRENIFGEALEEILPPSTLDSDPGTAIPTDTPNSPKSPGEETARMISDLYGTDEDTTDE